LPDLLAVSDHALAFHHGLCWHLIRVNQMGKYIYRDSIKVQSCGLSFEGG
jgi:hypothetical protein